MIICTTWIASVKRNALAASTLTVLGLGAALPFFVWAAPSISSHPNPPLYHSTQTVTGSYDGPNKASLDVLQLPGERIQFDLQAYSHFSPANGPNMGEVSGVVSLHQGVAVYQDHPNADNVGRGGGRLTLRFRGNKAVVTEQGNLEFGAGVSAGGTYIRHSRKPPKFNKDGQAI